MLLQSQAATVGGGSSDVTMSANSRFLHVKNSLQGTVTTFRVDEGTLTKIDSDRDASNGAGSIGIAGK